MSCASSILATLPPSTLGLDTLAKHQLLSRRFHHLTAHLVDLWINLKNPLHLREQPFHLPKIPPRYTDDLRHRLLLDPSILVFLSSKKAHLLFNQRLLFVSIQRPIL